MEHKDININYFSNNRLQFFDLIFYFINKIKPENKSRININILTTNTNANFFIEKGQSLELNSFKIIPFNDGFNYTEKLQFAINEPYRYSIKLDEDCIINNHIWDYIIENTDVLENDDNLLLSPLLSTTIPSCDEFIKGFLSEEEINHIETYFLCQSMPNGLFGVNYESLNEFTINANAWDYRKYLNGLSKLPTETKGMHPMRISYKAQKSINEFILKKYENLLIKNDYEIFEIESPYFTNNLFMIRTDIWENIIHENGGIYDEIPITRYKNINNKKYLFIKNAFGVHTMYNTIYGNKNKWNIGGENAEQEEIEFVNNLTKLIIK